MIWLVCYDIASPKRLQKIGHYGEKFGIRLQKSVFQVDNKETLQKLLARIKELMNRKYGSLIIFPICEDCRRMIVIDGQNNLINPESVIIL
jgi:CRISPR-associated protein Cas2